MSNSADKVELQSFDDLFGGKVSAGQEQVLHVNLNELYDFNNHPFQVRDNDEMLELAESIQERGVLVPGLVRPRKAGGYEIIAGHRRKRGSTIAGQKTMPVICRELTDDDATVIMVDSNIQRENLLPSEKAFAYRMKMEALRHQGRKGEDSAQSVGEKGGDNARSVQRYIRLTYLLPELRDAVDQKKIAFIAGAELSFLSEEEQQWLVKSIDEVQKYPAGKVAAQMKEYSKSGELTEAIIKILLQGTETSRVKVVIKDSHIREYFPASYDKEKIEQVIFSLLEEWKAEHQEN